MGLHISVSLLVNTVAMVPYCSTYVLVILLSNQATKALYVCVLK